MNIITVSNSFASDKGQFVGPYLGPNCLQKHYISADNTIAYELRKQKQEWVGIWRNASRRVNQSTSQDSS